MMTIDVGVDIDGVLYPFDEILQRYLVEHRGHDVTNLPLPPRMWDWWKEDWDMTLEEFLSVCNEAVDSGFMFVEGAPYGGSVAAINALKDSGHRVHFITSRSFGSRSVHNTADWLYKWGVNYDSLILSHSKHLFRPDIMIDDYQKNVEAMVGVGVETWLLDRPWNQDFNYENRVYDLDSFVMIVEEAAERKAYAS